MFLDILIKSKVQRCKVKKKNFQFFVSHFLTVRINMKFVYAAPLLLVAAAAEHPADCRMKFYIENEENGYKTETVGVGLFMTSVFTSKGKNCSITTIAVDDRGGGGELGGGLGGGPQPFVKQFQQGESAQRVLHRIRQGPKRAGRQGHVLQQQRLGSRRGYSGKRHCMLKEL